MLYHIPLQLRAYKCTCRLCTGKRCILEHTHGSQGTSLLTDIHAPVLCWLIEQSPLLVHTKAVDKQDLPNGPGFGRAEPAASLHRSNKSSPSFFTSSAQPWWDLGLLTTTLSLKSYLGKACRCLREKGAVLEKRGLVCKGTSRCSSWRELGGSSRPVIHRCASG